MRRLRILLWVFGGACGIFIVATSVLVFAGLHEQLGKADVALVLGNKVESDGSPSRRLRARLDRTIELYRNEYFPTVIVSGALGKEGSDEAVVMRNYLLAHGVPAERIIVDSCGTTTFASARNTFLIARAHNFSSVFVVSQYFHLPRACMALRRYGISTVYSAHPRFFELRDIYSSARELVGYVSYLFRRYDRTAPESI